MQGHCIGHPARSVPVMVFEDPRALGEALASDIVEGVANAARKGRRYLLGCPGGRSPMPVYHALGRICAVRKPDLSRLVIVMMDEYLIRVNNGFVNCPADAHYSCHRFAEEHLRGALNRHLAKELRVPKTHVWFPAPDRPATYDAKIRAAGGIDLFLVAVGAGDGHVAFNPPGDRLNSRTRIVKLPDSTRRDNVATFPEFRTYEEVPEYGVSIGLGSITCLSRAVTLIAHGDDKREAVRRLTAARGDFVPSWPASFIFRCRNACIMLDKTAAKDWTAND
jgi:glucosamine-6-phosphate deaminase